MVAMVSVCMFSCSKVNTEDETVTNAESKTVNEVKLEELQLRIADLTEKWSQDSTAILSRVDQSEYISTSPVASSVSVVHADLTGAWIGSRFGWQGALIGGSLASAIAYWEKKHDKDNSYMEIGINEANDGIVVFDGSSTMMDSIGYYHNLILNNIGEEKLSNADSLDLEGLVIKSAKELLGNRLNTSEFYGLKTDKAYLYLGSSMSKLNKASNTEAYCEMLCTDGGLDVSTVGVLKEYLKGIQVVNNTNGKYTQLVLKNIEGANLDKGTEVSLKNAVLVGNASKKMWKE